MVLEEEKKIQNPMQILEKAMEKLEIDIRSDVDIQIIGNFFHIEELQMFN